MKLQIAYHPVDFVPSSVEKLLKQDLVHQWLKTISVEVNIRAPANQICLQICHELDVSPLDAGRYVLVDPKTGHRLLSEQPVNTQIDIQAQLPSLPFDMLFVRQGMPEKLMLMFMSRYWQESHQLPPPLPKPFSEISAKSNEALSQLRQAPLESEVLCFRDVNLNIDDSNAKNAVITRVEKMELLSQLEIHHCTLGAGFMRQLIGSMKLPPSSVTIQHSKSFALEAFRSCISVLSEKTIAAVAQLHPGSQAQHLLDTVQENPSLRYALDELSIFLDLESNNIADKDVFLLAQAISKPQSLHLQALKDSHFLPLRVLNLHNNAISDDGTRALGHALQTSSCLRILDLSCNQITSTGAKVVAAALRQNYCLTELNCSNNFIDDSGILAFGFALMENSTLRVLDLSSNKIQDEKKICQAYGTCVEHNFSICHITLSVVETHSREAWERKLQLNRLRTHGLGADDGFTRKQMLSANADNLTESLDNLYKALEVFPASRSAVQSAVNSLAATALHLNAERQHLLALLGESGTNTPRETVNSASARLSHRVSQEPFEHGHRLTSRAPSSPFSDASPTKRYHRGVAIPPRVDETKTNGVRSRRKKLQIHTRGMQPRGDSELVTPSSPLPEYGMTPADLAPGGVSQFRPRVKSCRGLKTYSSEPAVKPSRAWKRLRSTDQLDEDPAEDVDQDAYWEQRQQIFSEDEPLPLTRRHRDIHVVTEASMEGVDEAIDRSPGSPLPSANSDLDFETSQGRMRHRVQKSRTLTGLASTDMLSARSLSRADVARELASRSNRKRKCVQISTEFDDFELDHRTPYAPVPYSSDEDDDDRINGDLLYDVDRHHIAHRMRKANSFSEPFQPFGDPFAGAPSEESLSDAQSQHQQQPVRARARQSMKIVTSRDLPLRFRSFSISPGSPEPPSWMSPGDKPSTFGRVRGRLQKSRTLNAAASAPFFPLTVEKDETNERPHLYVKTTEIALDSRSSFASSPGSPGPRLSEDFLSPTRGTRVRRSSTLNAQQSAMLRQSLQLQRLPHSRSSSSMSSMANSSNPSPDSRSISQKQRNYSSQTLRPGTIAEHNPFSATQKRLAERRRKAKTATGPVALYVEQMPKSHIREVEATRRRLLQPNVDSPRIQKLRTMSVTTANLPTRRLKLLSPPSPEQDKRKLQRKRLSSKLAKSQSLNATRPIVMQVSLARPDETSTGGAEFADDDQTTAPTASTPDSSAPGNNNNNQTQRNKRKKKRKKKKKKKKKPQAITGNQQGAAVPMNKAAGGMEGAGADAKVANGHPQANGNHSSPTNAEEPTQNGPWTKSNYAIPRVNSAVLGNHKRVGSLGGSSSSSVGDLLQRLSADNTVPQANPSAPNAVNVESPDQPPAATEAADCDTDRHDKEPVQDAPPSDDITETLKEDASTQQDPLDAPPAVEVLVSTEHIDPAVETTSPTKRSVDLTKLSNKLEPADESSPSSDAGPLFTRGKRPSADLYPPTPPSSVGQLVMAAVSRLPAKNSTAVTQQVTKRFGDNENREATVVPPSLDADDAVDADPKPTSAKDVSAIHEEPEARRKPPVPSAPSDITKTPSADAVYHAFQPVPKASTEATHDLDAQPAPSGPVHPLEQTLSDRSLGHKRESSGKKLTNEEIQALAQRYNLDKSTKPKVTEEQTRRIADSYGITATPEKHTDDVPEYLRYRRRLSERVRTKKPETVQRNRGMTFTRGMPVVAEHKRNLSQDSLSDKSSPVSEPLPSTSPARVQQVSGFAVAKTCSCCSKPFGMFRWKKPCLQCGAATCSGCLSASICKLCKFKNSKSRSRSDSQ